MEKQILFDMYDYYDDEEYTVQDGWNDFTYSLSKTSGYVVITGYFMSWMGPRSGGLVCPSLKTAVETIVMDDSHPIFSIDSDGDFVLDETHHDAPCAGNHYVFRVLTKKGATWYENNVNRYDKRTVCEKLFNTKGYSRKVNSKDILL